uniref:Uncharacterized protein n=1 Tax=Rhizophora mucronata TaxID=61149 RepID=A0A2P2MYN9_RHIMU
MTNRAFEHGFGKHKTFSATYSREISRKADIVIPTASFLVLQAKITNINIKTFENNTKTTALLPLTTSTIHFSSSSSITFFSTFLLSSSR